MPNLRKRKKSESSSAGSGEEQKEENKEDEEEYIVEQILGHRVGKKGLEYLLRWKGWSKDSDTWEPAKHLHCTDLIKGYERKQKRNGRDLEENKREKALKEGAVLNRRRGRPLKDSSTLTEVATPLGRVKKTSVSKSFSEIPLSSSSALAKKRRRPPKSMSSPERSMQSKAKQMHDKEANLVVKCSKILFPTSGNECSHPDMKICGAVEKERLHKQKDDLGAGSPSLQGAKVEIQHVEKTWFSRITTEFSDVDEDGMVPFAGVEKLLLVTDPIEITGDESIDFVIHSIPAANCDQGQGETSTEEIGSRVGKAFKIEKKFRAEDGSKDNPMIVEGTECIGACEINKADEERKDSVSVLETVSDEVKASSRESGFAFTEDNEVDFALSLLLRRNKGMEKTQIRGIPGVEVRLGDQNEAQGGVRVTEAKPPEVECKKQGNAGLSVDEASYLQDRSENAEISSVAEAENLDCEKESATDKKNKAKGKQKRDAKGRFLESGEKASESVAKKKKQDGFNDKENSQTRKERIRKHKAASTGEKEDKLSKRKGFKVRENTVPITGKRTLSIVETEEDHTIEKCLEGEKQKHVNDKCGTKEKEGEKGKKGEDSTQKTTNNNQICGQDTVIEKDDADIDAGSLISAQEFVRNSETKSEKEQCLAYQKESDDKLKVCKEFRPHAKPEKKREQTERVKPSFDIPVNASQKRSYQPKKSMLAVQPPKLASNSDEKSDPSDQPGPSGLCRMLPKQVLQVSEAKKQVHKSDSIIPKLGSSKSGKIPLQQIDSHGKMRGRPKKPRLSDKGKIRGKEKMVTAKGPKKENRILTSLNSRTDQMDLLNSTWTGLQPEDIEGPVLLDFKKAMQVEKIIGECGDNFVLKSEDGDVDIVPCHLVNHMLPHLVSQWYETRLQWTTTRRCSTDDKDFPPKVRGVEGNEFALNSHINALQSMVFSF